MTNKTEAQVLAEAFKSVRNLTKFYMQNLKEEDVHKQYKINGVKMNSAYWITAHLVWSEYMLIIEGLGGKKIDIPWLNDFGFGSKDESKDNRPPYSEVLEKMDLVHEQAMNLLKSQTDEQLGEPNLVNATFGQSNEKRAVVRHCIRHEPMHVGQISWIIKASGGKMV